MVQLSVTSFIEFLGGQGAPVTAASGKGVLDARVPLSPRSSKADIPFCLASYGFWCGWGPRVMLGRGSATTAGGAGLSQAALAAGCPENVGFSAGMSQGFARR